MQAGDDDGAGYGRGKGVCFSACFLEMKLLAYIAGHGCRRRASLTASSVRLSAVHVCVCCVLVRFCLRVSCLGICKQAETEKDEPEAALVSCPMHRWSHVV